MKKKSALSVARSSKNQSQRRADGREGSVVKLTEIVGISGPGARSIKVKPVLKVIILYQYSQGFLPYRY